MGPDEDPRMEGIVVTSESDNNMESDTTVFKVIESYESQADVSRIRKQIDENMTSKDCPDITTPENLSMNSPDKVSTNNSPCKAEVNQIMEMSIDASNVSTNLKTTDNQSIFNVVDVEAKTPDVDEKNLVDSDIEIEF